MTCRAFESWLDAGRPATGRDEFLRHAGQCAACAGALQADEALALALNRTQAAAPGSFTDRVMARIHAPVIVPILAPAVPWWLRALTDPAAVLAGALLAVLTGAWSSLPALAAGAVVLTQRLNGIWSAAADAMVRTRWGAILERPEVTLGVQLGALCLALAAVPVLYRASLRLASRVSR